METSPTVVSAPDSSVDEKISLKIQLAEYVSLLTRTQVVDTVGPVTGTPSACLTSSLVWLFTLKITTG